MRRFSLLILAAIIALVAGGEIMYYRAEDLSSRRAQTIELASKLLNDIDTVKSDIWKGEPEQYAQDLETLRAHINDLAQNEFADDELKASLEQDYAQLKEREADVVTIVALRAALGRLKDELATLGDKTSVEAYMHYADAYKNLSAELGKLGDVDYAVKYAHFADSAEKIARNIATCGEKCTQETIQKNIDKLAQAQDHYSTDLQVFNERFDDAFSCESSLRRLEEFRRATIEANENSFFRTK